MWEAISVFPLLHSALRHFTFVVQSCFHSPGWHTIKVLVVLTFSVAFSWQVVIFLKNGLGEFIHCVSTLVSYNFVSTPLPRCDHLLTSQWLVCFLFYNAHESHLENPQLSCAILLTLNRRFPWCRQAFAAEDFSSPIQQRWLIRQCHSNYCFRQKQERASLCLPSVRQSLWSTVGQWKKIQ